MITLTHTVTGTAIGNALADDMEEAAYALEELLIGSSLDNLRELTDHISNSCNSDRLNTIIEKLVYIVQRLENV